ncbi:MAG: phosphoheptose isomerase [Bacteroidia bacterium]|nr:phosphoheptose isomerase [Bacteroidia bacterium]
MQLQLTQKETRSELFETVGNFLSSLKLKVASKDFERPWGGFYVINEEQAQQFSKIFFPNVEFSDLQISGKLSPKILMVEANKRLSWQYHNRRAEIWKLIGGTAGVVISSTDEQGPLQKLKEQEVIQLAQGQRHRLVGTDGWGVIAEIWRHTDARNPSDENDIIRLQDDFGR